MSGFVSRKKAMDVAMNMTRAAYEDCAKMLEFMAERADQDLPNFLSQNKPAERRTLVLMIDGGREFAAMAAQTIRKKAETLELALTTEGSA